jgi:hypothetical protein
MTEPKAAQTPTMRGDRVPGDFPTSTSLAQWNGDKGEFKVYEVSSLSNEDLVDEFGVEEWASDRTTSMEESADALRSRTILRTEILRRMSMGQVCKKLA